MKNLVIVLVHGHSSPPDLGTVARDLGVSVDDIDADQGVGIMDPNRGTYWVMVEADALPPDFEKRVPFQGPYSNPRIGPP